MNKATYPRATRKPSTGDITHNINHKMIPTITIRLYNLLAFNAMVGVENSK